MSTLNAKLTLRRRLINYILRLEFNFTILLLIIIKKNINLLLVFVFLELAVSWERVHRESSHSRFVCHLVCGPLQHYR